MKRNSKAHFTLLNYLNWKIESFNKDWINLNTKEFYSSFSENQFTGDHDFIIKEVSNIEKEKNASYLSENIYGQANCIYIKDKYSDKLLKLSIDNGNYLIQIEQGFTFYYYAAFIDAFIKLIALKKNIVPLHASALEMNDEYYIFCAYRRIGKTTVLLNLLKQDNKLSVLADDVVFLTKDGVILPYQRGIDLYPYLPISKQYIGTKEVTQRFFAAFIQDLPFLSESFKTRLVKHSFLPRLNLAEFYSYSNILHDGLKKVFMLKKSESKKTSIRQIDRSELIEDISKSSFFEIKEYQHVFEKHKEKFPESPFSDLITNYAELQIKVNRAIDDKSYLAELSLSNDYSDLDDLCRII